MDVRGKLVELLKEQFYDEYEFETIADDLISQGVTVQEWIPISEPPKEKGTYLVCTDNGGVLLGHWYGTAWNAGGRGKETSCILDGKAKTAERRMIMDNCRQACQYNTLYGCKDKEYNAICPLTNMATPITEYKMTNADHIRDMSIDELNDFLGKVADHEDNCPYVYGSVKSLEWLKKPYAQKEYKKI